MAPINNKWDILDILKLVPAPVFDGLLIHILVMDTDVYQNNKPINDLKDAVANYYGVHKVDGHWEVKPELTLEAKKVTQELVDHFLFYPL